MNPTTIPAATNPGTEAPPAQSNQTQAWPPASSAMVEDVRRNADDAFNRLIGGNAAPPAPPAIPPVDPATAPPAAPPVAPPAADAAASPETQTPPTAPEAAHPDQPPAAEPGTDPELDQLLAAEFGQTGDSTVPSGDAKPEASPEDEFDLTKQHPEVQKYLGTKFAQKVFANHRVAAETKQALDKFGLPLNPEVIVEHVKDARLHTDLLARFSGEHGETGRREFIDYYFGNDPATGKPYTGATETLRQLIDVAANNPETAPYFYGTGISDLRNRLAVLHGNSEDKSEKQRLAIAVGVLDQTLDALGLGPSGTPTRTAPQPSAPDGSGDPRDTRIAELESKIAELSGRAPAQVQRSEQERVMASAVGQHIRRIASQFDKIVGVPADGSPVFRDLRTAFVSGVRAECMKDPQFAHDMEMIMRNGPRLQPAEVAVISHRISTKTQQEAGKYLRARAAAYRNVVHGGKQRSTQPPSTQPPAAPPAQPPQSPQPSPLTPPSSSGNLAPSGAPAGTSGQQPAPSASRDSGLERLSPGERAAKIALEALERRLGQRG